MNRRHRYNQDVIMKYILTSNMQKLSRYGQPPLIEYGYVFFSVFTGKFGYV